MEDRLMKLEKQVNELQNDMDFIKEVFEGTSKDNEYFKKKIQAVKDLCNNKMKEYSSILNIYGKGEKITKIAKIEKDLAQQIYTLLF